MEQFYTVTDFLENPHFRSWLKSPDTESTRYWNTWLINNPSKKELFETALAAYLALEGNSLGLSNKDISERVLKITDSLPEGPLKRVWWRRTEWAWAAVFVAALGAGWLLWMKEPKFAPALKTEIAASEITADENHRVLIKNTGNEAMLLNLPDRSSVLLAKNSQLEYIDDTETFQREVNLKGEAFFEIIKNPNRPFYVHTAALTTKVLGTSFLVRSFDEESRATVRVRTGKVEVTPNTKEASLAENAAGADRAVQSKTLLLLPNEQASVIRKTHTLARDTKVLDPVEDMPKLFDLHRYEFRFTPVTEIFDLLEKTYGRQIAYDHEKFKNCTVTANLTDEPFLEKIRLICISMEAGFEVSEKEITVSGAGCMETATP